MKQAVVFLRGIKAGVLTEDENGYTFEYDANYLASADAEAVSLTLPLSDKPYRDKVQNEKLLLYLHPIGYNLLCLWNRQLFQNM